MSKTVQAGQREPNPASVPTQPTPGGSVNVFAEHGENHTDAEHEAKRLQYEAENPPAPALTVNQDGKPADTPALAALRRAVDNHNVIDASQLISCLEELYARTHKG